MFVSKAGTTKGMKRIYIKLVAICNGSAELFISLHEMNFNSCRVGLHNGF